MLLKCDNKSYGTATTAKSQYFSDLQIFLMNLDTYMLLMHRNTSTTALLSSQQTSCYFPVRFPVQSWLIAFFFFPSKPKNRYIGLEGCYGTRQESKLAMIYKSHILAEYLCNGVAASHELFVSELIYFPVQPETY